MRLDIVMPAHNEQERIDRTLRAYRAACPDAHVRFLVALDSCTDATPQIVARHARDDVRVRAFAYPKLGKGGVITATFARSDADLVGFVDADGATPPRELLRLAGAAEEMGGAIASRRHPAALLPARRPLARELTSAGFASSVRMLMGLPYRDTQCGAKVLRRDVADDVLPHLATRDLVVAGPWARADAVVNPSYLSPRAFDALGWRAAAESARRALGRLGDPLPPDWARLEGDVLAPTGPPDTGEPAVYGYDAARVPLRLAESCSPEDRRLAARAWPALRDRDPLPAVLGLDGAARTDDSHPVALAGAAGAAHAAGDHAAADELLDRAGDMGHDRPSYYGAAWTALARVMLDTDWLGNCG